MRTRFVAALAALLIGAGLATPSSAAADVPGLEIVQIGYNAYGADQPWNRNQEFIDIKNTSTEPVDVKGLRVEDAWAHGRGSGAGQCNNYTLTSLPGVVEADGKLLLSAGHTIRVYVGSGTAAVFGDGQMHAVYMNHNVACGYRGHFLNNGAQRDKGAPWDTVWITLGSASESKSYNFSRGYTAH
ncbi:hypothetical protein [Nonomuraea sp. SYSU D8015]|uniref:hypothetical protein n=1 Tax=Nonomuraea sp. SYSU D8015 TaxID=2593644 RepID=UPI001660C490|nr:hypothetical protein [Nonomuraea sp. SYSU D8015]